MNVNYPATIYENGLESILKLRPKKYHDSSVKLLEDPKQIATQTLFAFLTILELYCKHTKSIPKSEHKKFDIFHCLGFEGISQPPTYV